MSAWQDISTAPKDGHFIGWNATENFPVVWSAKNFHWSLQDDAPPGIACLREEAENTTHWMLLEPPEGSR